MSKPQRRGHARCRMLIRMLFCLLGLAVVGYLALIGHVYYAKTHVAAPPDDTDAIIVLGAQVKPDGELSLQLQFRLETALAHWRARPQLMLVCGAQGGDEPTTEAEAMRVWLVKNGVPEADILMEDQSFNTRENLENACQLLPESIRRVLIVTSDYHLPRALAIARDFGLDAYGVGSPIKNEFWIRNYAREALAWCKYWVEKYTPLRL